MIEVLGELFAGLGLFFVGVKMIGRNLRKITSRRFREMISGWTATTGQAGFLGFVAGAVTQSSSGVTFIVVSLVTSGLTTVRRALPLLAGSNIGLATLVLAASFDIRVFVFYLLGLTGIAFAFERPARHREAVASLFGIGLLFLGLQTIRGGVAPLRDLEWFHNALLFTRQSHFLSLGLGAILTVIAQSSATVSVLAIAMTRAGLFHTDQTIMIIYGTNLGSSVVTWLLSGSLRGTSRQVSNFQLVFNLVGAALFVPCFYLEYHGHVPGVRALVEWLSPNIEQQMAYVYLLFKIGTAAAFVPFFDLTERALARACPPTVEEDISRTVYLSKETLEDPESSVELVEKELARMIGHIPEFLEGLREGGRERMKAAPLHAALGALGASIHGYLGELFDRDPSRDVARKLLLLQARHQLVTSLEDAVHEFHVNARSALAPGSPIALPVQNLVESGDTLLRMSVDAFSSGDDMDREMLVAATGDRGSLMERLRETHLSAETPSAADQKSQFLFLTSLFERIVWILNRLGAGLNAPASEGSAAS